MKPIKWIKIEFNQDCYVDPSQLDSDIRALQEMGGRIDRVYGARTSLSLIKYCETKQREMKARTEGRMADAISLGQECDRIYNRLPGQVRW